MKRFGIPQLYDMWKEKRRIVPFIIIWPDKDVPKVEGGTTANPCSYDLPKDKAKWAAAMRELITLTSPYAMLLVEQREDCVCAILETAYGSMCWRLPIQRRGDLNILKKATTTTDVENIGLLWRPRKPVS